MRTSLCPLLGIEHPIVGFSPSEHVAAAISRAGGLGVLGCVRFNDPADLDKVLDWMDANTDGKPYGVDVVMPARVPAEGAPVDLSSLIPVGHREFVADTLLKLGVPPLPDDSPAGDGVLGWLHSVARQHVEVALAHPARLIANALGPPPPDVISRAHERGMLVAALAGKAAHARGHVASGVDIVVAQGYEAGGHTGEIASMVLIPEIVDAVGARRAGARRRRHRLRPSDRRRARPGRRRRLDGLGLADHPGVRASPRPRRPCGPRCLRPRPRTRCGRGSTAASPRGCCATAGHRPGPSRAHPSRCPCRCRTCWSARRTSA